MNNDVKAKIREDDSRTINGFPIIGNLIHGLPENYDALGRSDLNYYIDHLRNQILN